MGKEEIIEIIDERLSKFLKIMGEVTEKSIVATVTIMTICSRPSLLGTNMLGSKESCDF